MIEVTKAPAKDIKSMGICRILRAFNAKGKKRICICVQIGNGHVADLHPVYMRAGSVDDDLP